jgi:hypothetical protein
VRNGDAIGADFPSFAVVVAVDCDGISGPVIGWRAGLGSDAEARSSIRVDEVNGAIVGESDDGVEGGFGRDAAGEVTGILMKQELPKPGVVDGENEALTALIGGLGEGVAVGGGKQGDFAAEAPEAVDVVRPFASGLGPGGTVVHRAGNTPPYFKVALEGCGV